MYLWNRLEKTCSLVTLGESQKCTPSACSAPSPEFAAFDAQSFSCYPLRMNGKNTHDADQFDPEQAAARRDEVLRQMLNTPPQPHARLSLRIEKRRVNCLSSEGSEAPGGARPWLGTLRVGAEIVDASGRFLRPRRESAYAITSLVCDAQ